MPAFADKITSTAEDVQLKNLLIARKKKIPVQIRFNINQAIYSVQ